MKYRNLIKQLQGIDHISWNEEVTDSGLSTTFSTTSDSSGRQGSKRKYISSNEQLDGTFFISPSKAKANSEQFVTKGGLLHSYISTIMIEVLHHGINIIIAMLNSK